MPSVTILSVLVGDVPVGRLAVSSNGQSEFRLLESYKNLYPRPVLGQVFLDDMSAVQRSRSRLPPWFSNLLPEGALRELIAKSAGVDINRESVLLQLLGEDLPGNVRVVLASNEGQGALFEGETYSPAESVARREDDAWHFSLAGAQLKFSAVMQKKKLTIPVSGAGGDWIVKLPDQRFEGVPRNEFATMSWAKLAGIQVPDIALVEADLVDGLPQPVAHGAGEFVFAVRRFDRKVGARIHMEDFAQILNIFPEGKYDYANYETIGRVLFAVTGLGGFEEFVRRLVFVIASGNGDAHLKNWSLFYPSEDAPLLSPAYDLVSTIQYMPADRLALNLGGSKDWSRVSLETFSRLARKVGVDEASVLAVARESIVDIKRTFEQHVSTLGYLEKEVDVLRAHMRTVPLLS